MSFNALTPLNWFFFALAVAALITEIWAFADAVFRPTAAFPAASKQTKPLWLIITGVAAAIGLYSVVYLGQDGPQIAISILPVAAFIAAAVYLTDVRPKVREIGGRGGSGSTHQGPYGPW